MATQEELARAAYNQGVKDFFGKLQQFADSPENQAMRQQYGTAWEFVPPASLQREMEMTGLPLYADEVYRNLMRQMYSDYTQPFTPRSLVQAMYPEYDWRYY